MKTNVHENDRTLEVKAGHKKGNVVITVEHSNGK